MSEGNQYLSGYVNRIDEQLRANSVYAPALRVLLHDQVSPEARCYVEQVLSGEGVFWDLPPLSRESWDVFASITGFYSQALRLLGSDVSIDVWHGWMRSQWICADWSPLPREFGWKVACRPFRGIFFRNEEPDIERAMSYLSSWPHGWLTLQECRSYAPMLHELLLELAQRLDLDWPLAHLEARLEYPDKLTRDELFELNNLSSFDSTWSWQFQRGLCLLGAMRVAIERERDLISVGY